MPSREHNREHWEQWDWSTLGEEWTPADPRWKAAIVRYSMQPYLRGGETILEIGPGGGRWTAELLRLEPRRIIAVDLTERCIELCRKRFLREPRLELHRNDGRDLSFVADDTIDFIYSFDVFVHVEAPEIDAYFGEFARVLRPGGRAAIHYASLDRAPAGDPRRGWRADFTSVEMHALLAKHGFALVADYYEPWISCANSSVVVFERPA